MRSDRAEFSRSTKIAAFERSKGRCESPGCNRYIVKAEYDHIIPAAIGGSNDLDNCQVLCAVCHGDKTRNTDVPEIAKTKRIIEKRAGLRKRGGFRGHRRFDGTVVWNNRR